MSDNFEDGWLESRYEDMNGGDVDTAVDYEVDEDPGCCFCGADPDQPCYPDCPESPGGI